MSNLKKLLQRKHPTIHIEFARQNIAPPVNENALQINETSAFNASVFSTETGVTSAIVPAVPVSKMGLFEKRMYF
jgi:hypothetical protein